MPVLRNYEKIEYTTVWGEKAIIEPSAEQLKIITSQMDKDTKIIACAGKFDFLTCTNKSTNGLLCYLIQKGSGKTTSLVLRLQYLLDQGVKACSIIVSTFNVEASKSIRQKVKEIIGKNIRIKIGNIDKLALGFIKKELNSQQNQSTNVLRFCQREHSAKWLDHIKKKQGFYKKFKYFFFDEFQDVSEWQYEALMEFKKLGCILTVIGDPAQNIYAFRGTKIDIILNRIDNDLRADNLELSQFNLTMNFRSTPPITSFANEIFSNSELQIENMVSSQQKPEDALVQLQASSSSTINLDEQPLFELPYLHIFQSKKMQNEYIIEKIFNLVDSKKCQFKDIAIIAPQNNQLKNIEEYIEKENEKKQKSQQIPYTSRITCKSNIYKQNIQRNTQTEESITLSTIHQSKGLEWDIVFFIGCNDDKIPMSSVYQNVDKPNLTLEEQRRLFYVGVTRAAKELHFCCIQKPLQFQTEDDKKQGKYQISRFFADIPQTFYQSDDQIPCEYKWIEFESQKTIKTLTINEVISLMSTQKLQEMNQYLQNVTEEKQRVTLYEKIEIGVSDDLFNKMGIFFDRLVVRLIGEKYKALNAFYDDVAVQVILPYLHDLNIIEKCLYSYLKYHQFFLTFTDKELEDVKLVEERFINWKGYNKTTEEIDKIKELYDLLTQHSKLNSLNLIQLFNFKTLGSSYFSQEYEKFGQSYLLALNDYMDKLKPSKDIYESIYKISKCQFLLARRNKILYEKQLDDILCHLLLQTIKDHFINNYLSQFNSFECKKIYKTEYITCQIDLIVNNHQLLFFRFNNYEEFSKEELLNYLFAAAVLRHNQKIDVQQIKIFNFLTGSIQSLDLKQWNQEAQYIQDMELFAKDQIKIKNAMRNQPSNEQQQSLLKQMFTKRNTVVNEDEEFQDDDDYLNEIDEENNED